jgi:peptide-methionine (S)-S-oxide reductase
MATRQPVPAPLQDTVASTTGQHEKAVFAGGCFWGVQSVFQRVKGVQQTIVGYSGGDAATANYRAVCSEETGHAEAIEIVYDPSLVSYGTLLRIFFSVVHDPTQLNRQGADVGTSYRSAIFYTSEQQREIAQAYVRQLDAAHIFARPIVTQITPLEAFYPGRTTPSRIPTTLTSRSATSRRLRRSSSSSPISFRSTSDKRNVIVAPHRSTERHHRLTAYAYNKGWTEQEIARWIEQYLAGPANRNGRLH